MRILVLHAWLKGNLGDVLQLSVLLSALRELRPATLDLAGFPSQPAPETGEVLTLVDRYVPDPFPWYWKAMPAVAADLVIEPWWRRRRTALFSSYDALVCAPGPYLADYDARAASALSDIRIARALDIPMLLSNHSIGPLRPAGLAAVGLATLRIARETATHRYLSERGLSAVASADLSFLYPFAEADGAGRVPRPYRLVFLRSNNLRAARLRLEHGTLFDGSRLIAEASSEPIVLATSDFRRDERFLARAARTLGVSSVACRSVKELVQLIGGSSRVVSDRYHPAICAAVLGKPSQLIPNREPHKMEGLRDLLAGRSVIELQELARAGLRCVQDVLRGAR